MELGRSARSGQGRQQVWLPVLLGFFLLILNSAWASQEALVTAEKAVIYSDIYRTSAIGYVKRGKTVKVGEVSRNKGQVLPIIVSGKVAYIATEDINLDLQVYGQQTLVAERFKEATKKKSNEVLSVGYVNFTATQSAKHFGKEDTESYMWHGIGMRGESRFNGMPYLGLNFLGEWIYNEMPEQKESYRMFNLGMGLSYYVIDAHRFRFKLEAFALFSPYAQMELDPLFSLRGMGYGYMGQAVIQQTLDTNWAMEFAGGYQMMQIFGLDVPKPFPEYNPTFTGARLSASAVYIF